jgi:hypothetical protein
MGDLRAAAQAFIDLHDAEPGTDETWPCNGWCRQARDLRAALAASQEPESGGLDAALVQTAFTNVVVIKDAPVLTPEFWEEVAAEYQRLREHTDGQ